MTRKAPKRGYRSHERGNLELDRTFRRLGALRVSSGTKDARVYRLLDAMLTQLYEGGRLDVLRSIRARDLAPLEVYEFFRVSKLDGLPTSEDMLPLKATVTRWLPTFTERNGVPITAKHRQQVGEALAKLTRRQTTAMVRQLPDLLRGYRKDCQDAGTLTVFNRTRSAALAFVRERLGIQSPIYGMLRAVPILSDRLTRKAGHPQTPEQAREIRKALGPVHGEVWWGMCATGTTQDEFWGKWEAGSDRVTIHGTKREGRSRVIPRLTVLTPPTMHRRTFENAFRDACPGLVPRDARRTFSHWLKEAGIDIIRIKIYMGHRISGTTELYLWHMVEPYLAEDRRKLLAYLSEPLEAGLAVMA